jgi:hypothetical protein
MRHAPFVALIFAALGSAAPAARAEWLVLLGGKRIATEGPWTLKGDLLTVHETSGRILTVGTSSVDTAACLKANGGSLRIEAIAVPPPAGAPVVKPEVLSPSAGPPRASSAPRDSAPPEGSARAGSASGGAKRPAAAGAAGVAGGDSAAAVSGTASGRPPKDDHLTAAKVARQARMQHELRYKQIVDGCARMFIVDRRGFQSCVDAQMQAPATPRPPAAKARSAPGGS